LTKGVRERKFRKIDRKKKRQRERRK
jgi:hypothetical protein